MVLYAVPTSAFDALPTLAQLLGCSDADLHGLARQLTAAWVVSGDSEVVGSIGLRPSPAHGMEVIGGASPGDDQLAAVAALIQAARADHPRLYAYAEDALMPGVALRAAGLRSVGANTRMTGSIPDAIPAVPTGFSIVSIAEASPLHLLAAQRCYSDRIGHTHVPDEVMEPGFGGTDDQLGRIAFDAAGLPAGICRVSVDGDEIHLGTPGVRRDVRGTGLRRALLLAACRAARDGGATRLILDAWGDTEAERQADEALGLQLAVETPIYAAGLG